MVRNLQIEDKLVYLKIDYGSSFNGGWITVGARDNRGQYMKVICTVDKETSYQEHEQFFIAQPTTNNLFGGTVLNILNPTQLNTLLNSKHYSTDKGAPSLIHPDNCEVYSEDEKFKPVLKEVLDCKNGKISIKLNMKVKKSVDRRKKHAKK